MTKDYNREEFVEYVKNLKFTELEDVTHFVNEYFNYYDSLPEENKEEKQLAWEKYVILISKYGHWFVTFSLMVLELRNEHLMKKMQEIIPNEQNS